jgi:hypothetical protein
MRITGLYFFTISKKTRHHDLEYRSLTAMHILAKAAGGEVDENYDVLEVFFAEGADGSGLVMTFQRQLSEEEPWNGDPLTDDYFNNSYCITLRSEAMIYGGLEQVSFWGSQGCFLSQIRRPRSSVRDGNWLLILRSLSGFYNAFSAFSRRQSHGEFLVRFLNSMG